MTYVFVIWEIHMLWTISYSKVLRVLGTAQKVQGGGGGPEHFEMWWLENT